ncbi:unnamed protein product, partial [Citrullus colocynthis]
VSFSSIRVCDSSSPSPTLSSGSPLLCLNQAILAITTLFHRQSLAELDYSDVGTLLVIRSYNDDLAEEEEICSICLTEFTRGDSSPECELLDCPFNCIQK